MPAVGYAGWLPNEEPPALGLAAVVARKRNVHEQPEAGVPSAVPNDETMEELMTVIIGVDPHKASHTAVAIDGDESELATIKVRSTRRQVHQLLAWAEPLGERMWAIESAARLGYLLSPTARRRRRARHRRAGDAGVEGEAAGVEPVEQE